MVGPSNVVICGATDWEVHARPTRPRVLNCRFETKDYFIPLSEAAGGLLDDLTDVALRPRESRQGESWSGVAQRELVDRPQGEATGN